MVNYVKSGLYKGKIILIHLGIPCIMNGKEKIDLAKWTISNYNIISGDTRKSMSSSIIRGAVGGALFGGVGALAGGLSAKNKTKYTIAVEFKNGGRSLIEIDDKIYTAFMSKMF